MQGLALPSSIPFLNLFNRNTNLRFCPTLSTSPSLKQVDNGFVRGVACVGTSHFGSFTRISSSFACFSQRFDSLKVMATSAPESVDEAPKSKALGILQLGGMFALWYSLNINFNIFNKQLLKAYPYPTTITAFQLGCGALMIVLMWTFNLHARPKLTRSQFATILPLAVAHTMGNLLTNVSIGNVNVSFTHTIKAMEPFFTVLFAFLFLREKPTFWIVSSLLPIVGGVALASFTEASFNWTGFCSAMASNVTNQSRNVLSKKFMVNKEETVDNINLFSVITIISFTLLVPAAIFIEGVKFTPSFLRSAAMKGLTIRELCLKLLLTGFCFHSYQQVSYMILQMVSPVTHAVGNCAKRVVVIVSSLLFFQIPVSPINSAGTVLALAGVFLYSRAKTMKPKAKTA